MIEAKHVQEEEAKLTPAPDAVRCDADGCGAGQPLYTTNGLVHCYTHKSWAASEDGKVEAQVRALRAKKKGA